MHFNVLCHLQNVAIYTYLSCSLMELIYHCVYCIAPTSRFMLTQYKRQQSREVLRTVFVCHRVPFLIPQAPAMPGGAVCGGGSWCKARPCRFSCFSESGLGDGLRGSQSDFLNPGHPVVYTRYGHFLHSFVMKIFVRIMYFN